MSKTITQLKADNDTQIRQKTQPKTLSTDNIADVIDGVIDRTVNNFTALTGNVWNVAEKPLVEKSMTAGNLALTTTGATPGTFYTILFLANNGYSATIDGQSVTLNSSGDTLVGILKKLDGSLYISSDLMAVEPPINWKAVYPFESNGDDSTTNALHLTAVNSSAFVTGKVGNAAEFVRSSSQYFKRAKITGLSSGFAVNFWIKLGTQTGVQRIMGCWSDAGVSEWLIYINNTVTIYDQMLLFHISQDGSSGSGPQTAEVACTVPMALSTWYNVTAIYYPGFSKIIIEGLDSVTLNHGKSMYSGAATEFRIGTDASGADCFNGQIDQVRIKTGSLTTSQIATLFNSGNGI